MALTMGAVDSPKLMNALSRVVKDRDLVDDIARTCVMTGITSKSLATDKHSVAHVAQQLFLTEPEATELIDECKGRCKPAPNPEVLVIVDGAEGGNDDIALLRAIAKKIPADDDHALDIPAESHEISVHLKVERSARGDRSNPLRASCPAAPLSRAFCPAAPLSTHTPNAVPSYLRPTATHQARSKNAPGGIQEEQPLSPPASPAPKKSSKYSKVLAKVFAPTATFLARITGKGPGAKAPVQPKGEVLRQSMMEKILKSPQGQRTTQAQPFSPHLTRPKEPETPQLSTQDLAILEAQKHQFKRNMVPKHVHQQRPIEGVYVASVPKKPEAIFEPFHLASQERHAAEQAKRAAEHQEQKNAEDAKRVFKALSFDKTLVSKVDFSPIKHGGPWSPTVPQAPQLQVEQRLKHHKEELEPARWSRMTAAERKKLEEREREVQAEEAFRVEQVQKQKAERERSRALEKMSVEEVRRSMVFKALPLPSPTASSFKPDLSKSAKVTQSLEFSFKTDERLGRALAQADRQDGGDAGGAEALGHGRFDGSGYADPFASSLRGGGGRRDPRVPSLLGPISPGGSLQIGGPAGRRAVGRGGAGVGALRASGSGVWRAKQPGGVAGGSNSPRGNPRGLQEGGMHASSTFNAAHHLTAAAGAGAGAKASPRMRMMSP